MDKADILYVDNSLLTSLDCSTKAVLRHVHGMTSIEEQANLISGRCNHTWMASWYRARDVAQADVEFMGAYKEWADENLPLDDRLGFNNLSNIHKAWADSHDLMDLPYGVTPDLIEVAFKFPLSDDGEIVYTGRMDLIVHSLTGGQVYPEDHKFTGNISSYWRDKWRLESGLTGYVWACGQYVGDARLVPGALVNAVETRKLPNSDRRCKDHGVQYAECSLQHAKFELMGPFTRTPEAIAEWKKTAIHLAKRYKDLLVRYPDIEQLHYVRTQGKFFNSCGFCDFQEFCSVGRPLQYVNSMLKYEPWSPFNEAYSLLEKKESS